MAAIGKRDFDIAVAILDLVDGGTKPKINAVFADLMGEFLNESTVDEIKECLTRLDQGYADIEGRKHRGIFDPNDARPHNDQAARDLSQFQKLVTVEDIGAVERDCIGAVGFRACRDQELITR